MNKPDTQSVATLHNLGTEPLPVEPFVSPEFYAAEVETIFKRCWLNVGFAGDIPNPGDYLVKDIETLNVSILFVRGQDGEIRAFHNACPHRGNKVATGRGNSKGFACGFHGWTFDLQGQLAFVPDEEQFFNLDKATKGLVPIHCDTWQNFIFFTLEETPEKSLKEYLGGLGEQIAGFPHDTMIRTGQYRARVKANWKVLVDAFQESYHAGFVHARSLGDHMASKANPYIHGLSFRSFDVHRSASMPYSPEHVPTPAEAKAFEWAMVSWTQEKSGAAASMAGLNPENNDNHMFDINVLFPHFFCDVGATICFTYNFWPTAVDETVFEVSVYMHPYSTASEYLSRHYNTLHLRDVLREDLNTMETTTAAQLSGAIQQLLFSAEEVLCRHQYKVVCDIVNGERTPYG